MRRIANIGIIDVVITLVITAVIAIALLGVRSIPVFMGLSVVYVLPYVMYARSSYSTQMGCLALSLAFVSMSIFMLLNYWQSTVLLGSVHEPFLLHDAKSFHILSHDIHNGTCGAHSPIVPYWGYPLFLSWWLDAGITDIAYPTIFNIGLMLLSMILVGRCVFFIIEDVTVARRVSGYAMGLVAIIPGILGMSTLLAKEPFIIFALLLCVCAMYAIKMRYKIFKYSIFLLLGLIIMASCRATYIYILGIFLLAIYSNKWSRRDVLPLIIIIFIMAVTLYGGAIFSNWGNTSYIEAYVSHGGNHAPFFCGESQVPLQRLIGDYNSYSLWMRILLLPLCVAVQFIIPFPFATVAPDYGLPISMTVYHRMSYLWYVAAIPMLMYYIFYWWRKNSITSMNLLAVASAIAYCIPAFITAGSVSRYAFCFVPFLAMMGGYVLYRVVDQREELKRMGVFAMIYVVLICAALFIGANPHLLVQ